MAQVFTVDMSTRETCLKGFAESYGTCPPRQPIPEWWAAFEAWYVETREACKKELDPNEPDAKPGILLRCETMGYEEEEDEDSDL